MYFSKCPSPWPRFPLLCLLNIQQLEYHRITILTRFVIFVFGFLKRYLSCGLWWVGLSFICCTLSYSLIAVFQSATAFNSDVSKWNTGAVTNMQGSECTLSLSLHLCGHGAFRCGVLLNIYDTSMRFVGSQVSQVLVLFFCGFETGPFVVVFVVGLVFLFFLLHPFLSSCSVFRRICVQFRRVHLEYGGSDNYDTK